MNPFIYFILYTVLLFVSYRITLSLSYVISISMSAFILLTYRPKALTYDMVIWLLFLNTLPFVINRLRKAFNNCKANMRGKLEDMKGSLDELRHNDEKSLQSNLEIERRLQQVSSLYEISKDMSECMVFEDIFNIFSSQLKKSFRFRLSRLVFLNEAIESVYQIEIGRILKNQAPDNFDKELVNIMLEAKENILLSSQDNSPFSRRLYVIKNFETLIAMPLMVDEKIAGMLYVENIPKIYFENFIILASQFIIQLQKVILYKRVEELSITDSLTEISTRRYFLERFKEEIRRSMRHKASLAFLMLDLDHFKENNDKYGHLVGDVILKEVANILRSSLREIDMICRYGGEEFSIALTGTGREGALQVAERLRLGIEKGVFKAYDEVVSTTVSIGVSVFPEDGVSEEDLIESADKALYKAKEAGRNRVC